MAMRGRFLPTHVKRQITTKDDKKSKNWMKSPFPFPFLNFRFCFQADNNRFQLMIIMGENPKSLELLLSNSKLRNAPESDNLIAKLNR